MDLDRAFFEGVIKASRQEQESLRANHSKQEGVIAFCEMILKKLDEQKPDGHL